MIARDYRVSCPTFTDIRASCLFAGCSRFSLPRDSMSSAARETGSVESRL